MSHSYKKRNFSCKLIMDEIFIYMAGSNASMSHCICLIKLKNKYTIGERFIGIIYSLFEIECPAI